MIAFTPRLHSVGKVNQLPVQEKSGLKMIYPLLGYNGREKRHDLTMFFQDQQSLSKRRVFPKLCNGLSLWSLCTLPIDLSFGLSAVPSLYNTCGLQHYTYEH